MPTVVGASLEAVSESSAECDCSEVEPEEAHSVQNGKVVRVLGVLAHRSLHCQVAHRTRTRVQKAQLRVHIVQVLNSANSLVNKLCSSNLARLTVTEQSK